MILPHCLLCDRKAAGRSHEAAELPNGATRLARAAELVGLPMGLRPAPDRQVKQAADRLTYYLGRPAGKRGLSRAFERTRVAGQFPRNRLSIGMTSLWARDSRVDSVTNGGARGL